MLTRYLSMTFLSATLLLSCVACGTGDAEGERAFVSIASNPSSSPAYQWAAALSDTINDEVESVRVTAEETEGYRGNARLIRDGSVEAAFTNSRLGRELYQNGHATGWLNFGDIHMHVVVSENSQIRQLSDLKGKRVGIGQPGGTSLMDTKAMLKEAGLLDEINAFKVHVSEQVSSMKDGQLDAVIWNGTTTVGPILDLVSARNVRFIPVPGGVVEGLHDQYPSYVEKTLPAGTYPGQDEDIDTFGLQNALVLSPEVSDQHAYEMTKAVMQNLEQLSSAHSAFKRMSKDTVISGLQMRVHPGAVRYFRESGVPRIEKHQESYESRKTEGGGE